MKRNLSIVLLAAALVVASARMTTARPPRPAAPHPWPSNRPHFPPSASPASQPSVDYFALSREDFAKLDALNQPLDFIYFDQKLLVAAILHETNRYRIEADLPPLQHLDAVDQAAMLHVTEMVAKSYIAHEETGTPYPRPMDRALAVGLKPGLVCENIASAFGIQYKAGDKVLLRSQWNGGEGLSYRENGPAIPPHTYRTFAAAAVKQWIDSPPHRKNIMQPAARYLGVACLPENFTGKETEDEFHKFYCGQVFFTPVSEASGNQPPTTQSDDQPDENKL